MQMRWSRFKNFLFAVTVALTIVGAGILLGVNERLQFVFDVLGGAAMFVLLKKPPIVHPGRI